MNVQSWLSFCLLMSLCVGCARQQSDYSKLDLVDVTGKVTLDGEPLSGAVITFDSPDGQFSFGQTDSGGNYSLLFDSVQRGVTPGEKIVRISTARKILGLNASEGGEDDPATAKSAEEKVPEKYNKASELKVTVGHDKTRHNFDLKSN